MVITIIASTMRAVENNFDMVEQVQRNPNERLPL